jgi:hypothetical protein
MTKFHFFVVSALLLKIISSLTIGVEHYFYYFAAWLAVYLALVFAWNHRFDKV